MGIQASTVSNVEAQRPDQISGTTARSERTDMVGVGSRATSEVARWPQRPEHFDFGIAQWEDMIAAVLRENSDLAGC